MTNKIVIHFLICKDIENYVTKNYKFDKDMNKKMDYMSEGMIYLAEAASHNSNAIEPLAEMSFIASLLAESIQENLDEQTKDIVTKLSSTTPTQ